MSALKPTMAPLLAFCCFLTLLLATPVPSTAAIYCSASCGGNSCSCIFCSCGCSGGDPWCGSEPQVAHAQQGQAQVLDVFKGGGDELLLETAQVVRGVEHGFVAENGDGSFFYQPEPSFVGLDSFAVQVCDVRGECHLGTVLVDVIPAR